MKLKIDETLFRDDSVFSPSYMPQEFLYRDSQIKEMTSCLRPALRGGRAQSALIFGRPATGKTTATKIIFSELEEKSNKAIAVHVNCHIYSSLYRILGEVHKKLFGFVPPETGIPVTSIYDKVFSKIAKEKKSLIIALDDLDFSDIKHANSILYDLVRVHEAYPNVAACVWCICVKNEMFRLDDKVRSALVTNTIEFLPYKQSELKEILKARAAEGLYPDAITDQLMEKIAGRSFDIRFGLELIKKAAIIAESEGSSKILEKHVDLAAKGMELPASSSLMEDEKIIIDLLKKGGKESGALYDEYKKITGASYSTFYRTIQKLKKQKKIDVAGIDKDRGKSRSNALKNNRGKI
jgi:archaeal cell division control protein 6